MFALLGFPGRPGIVPAWKQSGGLFQPACTSYNKSKSLDFSVEALCSRYLFTRVGQRIVLAVRKCPVDTCRQEKTSPFLVRFGVRVTWFHG